MEQQYKKFVDYLHKFITDLNRYYPNEGCKTFLSVFDKLDIGKVMVRYLHKMRENEAMLNSRDETLFHKPLVLFPHIDLSFLWKFISESRKAKIWTYLQILYVQAEVILNYKESTDNDSSKNKVITSMANDIKTNDNKIEFNPYHGIGSNDQNYNVNDVLEGIKDIKDEKITPGKMGLGTIASMIGIDKMLNIDELSDQLKNMSKEDIDDATDNIKKLLGPNVDENTSKLISNMLSGIGDELKKETGSSGNAFDSIMKIAENVADKIRPSMQSGDIDMKNLINSTKNLASQCKDSKGESIFGENNPFDMINNIIGNEPKTEEQYLAMCNNMLKNINPNSVNKDVLNQLTNMMNSKKSSNTRRNRKRHIKP